jgi:hypothetical protein
VPVVDASVFVDALGPSARPVSRPQRYSVADRTLREYVMFWKKLWPPNKPVPPNGMVCVCAWRERREQHVEPIRHELGCIEAVTRSVHVESIEKQKE